MKLRLRKRIKIAPGVYVNISSKGVSSVSVGGNGTTVNVGQRGVTATQSIPGTGISVSHTARAKATAPATPQRLPAPERSPSAVRGYFYIACLLVLAVVLAVKG